MSKHPRVTIVVPSYNQGAYLEEALISIFNQKIAAEIFVMDGGSTDESLKIIRKWEHLLSGWRSFKDRGQAAAINDGISKGTAEFVCWLNSDDWFLPNHLDFLIKAMDKYPNAPAVYARALNFLDKKQIFKDVWVEPFNISRLALRCIISQPAVLIRRSAWEAINGLDKNLHMAMDYDLWWRLVKVFGPLEFVDQTLAVNRVHARTKTKNNRWLHYREAIGVVRKHNGSLPLKWWLIQPYAVWLKSILP